MDKILVEIFGKKDTPAVSACSCKSKQQSSCNNGSGCNNCSGHDKCISSSAPSTIYELFLEVSEYLAESNLGEYVQTHFVDITTDDLASHEEILSLLKNDYEPPITVIDGIVRYCGGIRASLIYNDVKELLVEYYKVSIRY